jgi:hypothetical protein
MNGTRRDFLRQVANAGGYRAAYLTMQAMGLVGTAGAIAEPVTMENGATHGTCSGPALLACRQPMNLATLATIARCSKPVTVSAAATGPSGAGRRSRWRTARRKSANSIRTSMERGRGAAAHSSSSRARLQDAAGSSWANGRRSPIKAHVGFRLLLLPQDIFRKMRRLTARKAIQNQSLTSSVLNPRSREVRRITAVENEFRASPGCVAVRRFGRGARG